jgi:UDP-N-acetylmuramyl tripeptide synthase
LVGEVFGMSVHLIAHGLRDAQGAPGRLQAVRTGQPFAVLVDYAHTDDALENVLTALRPLTKGKLRVLFGCGGDRDRTKRPRMAKTAERLADVVYVTSDNPRTEQPLSIIQEIVATGARRSTASCATPSRATWCCSRARGTRTTRSSAPTSTTSTTSRRRCGRCKVGWWRRNGA